MDEEEYIRELKRLLIESIIKLADKDEKIGLAFSGGLDSCVLGKILVDLGYQVRGYVAGTRNSKDIEQAEKAAREIGIKLNIVELDEKEIDGAVGEQGKIIKKVYDSINLEGKEKNDSLTPNAIPISFNLPLFFVAKYTGEKKIFVSQGPDEMLGGYKRTEKMIEKDALKEMERNTKDFLKFGLKQNLETAKYWGKNFVMPYLSPEIVTFCLNLPYEMRINNHRKYILRKLAISLGIPEEVAMKEKKASQYGSGIIDVMKRQARQQGHHISWLVRNKIKEASF